MRRYQPLVSPKGKNRDYDLRKGPRFVVPVPWVLCLLVPQSLSVDLLSAMWAKGIGGKVYEILGFCSSKAVFLHKLINPFLALWQMLDDQEKVKAGLLKQILPFFSKLFWSSRQMGRGCSECARLFSAVSFLSPQPVPRLFWAILNYSRVPLENVGEGHGGGMGRGKES